MTHFRQERLKKKKLENENLGNWQQMELLKIEYGQDILINKRN